MADTQLETASEFDHFLNRLSEEQLRLLNRMVVERIRLHHKARDLHSMAKFNIADRVFFLHDGVRITGRIMKMNRRSVTVHADDGHRWTVAPSFLTHVIT